MPHFFFTDILKEMDLVSVFVVRVMFVFQKFRSAW